MEVCAAQGLCARVGAQHCGQPLGLGRGHLGRYLQEVQQWHVSGLLELASLLRIGNQPSPYTQTPRGPDMAPGLLPTPTPSAEPSHRFSLELEGVLECPPLFDAWGN